MSENESQNPITKPTAASVSLWFPIAFVLIFWGAYFALGNTEMANFARFLSKAGVLLLCLLGFTIWWFLRAPLSRTGTFAVYAWTIAVAVGTSFLIDPSVLVPAVLVLELPALLTAWTGWLFLSQRTTLCFPGMLVIGLLSFIPGLMVRMEGMKGDGSADFFPRWQETAESKMLAEEGKPSLKEIEPGQGDFDESTALVASETDWTGFRGPHQDASVPGITISTDWEKNPPKKIWSRRVGPGWSSITVVGDRIFTQEQIEKREYVRCFEATTGKPLWQHSNEGRFEEPLGGLGPRASPTFAQGRIVSLGASGILNCLDAQSGQLLWSKNVMKESKAEAPPMWGYSGSPLVSEGTIYVFAGGNEEKKIYAYDFQGKELWTAQAGVESYCSPQWFSIEGVPQILFVGDSLSSLDPVSGKKLWSYAPKASFARPVVQPRLVGKNQILVSFVPDQGVNSIEVTRSKDEWIVQEQWTAKQIKPDYSDFVDVGGFLYGFDGDIFCCVDLSNGKRIWKGGRYGSGQVLLLKDQPMLIVLTEAGELVLVSPNPKKHEELARWQAIEGKTWNHPALVGNRIYVRNAEEMACIELTE